MSHAPLHASTPVPTSWRRRLGTVFAYGTLAGLGYWGHLNHWNFSGHGHHAAHAAGTDHHAAAGHAFAHKPDSGTEHPADHDTEEHATNGSQTSVHLASTATDQSFKLAVAGDKISFPNERAVHDAKLVVVPVQVQPIERTVRAPGEIVYDETRMAQLSVRVPGKVWRVEKRLGQSVEAGEILGLVDSGDVGQAKADFLKALIQSRLTRKNYERIRTLVDIVPERQLRVAAADNEDAGIELFNAQQALHNLGLPVQVTDFDTLTQLQSLEHIRFAGLPQDYVATLPEGTTTANLIPLVAPFGGVVVGRDVVVGETADPSKTQFTIADLSRVWLILDVKYEDSTQLEIGQTVQFRVDGHQEPLETKITWISTASDEQTRTLKVRAELENPIVPSADDGSDSHRRFRANTFGQGQIVVEAREKGKLVPNSAIHRQNGQPIVFIRSTPTEFERREVQLGISTDTHTELLHGVPADCQVVSSGGHLLKAELGEVTAQPKTAARP